MPGVHLRKYGVEATVNFSLYEIDGVDLRKDDAPGTADIFIMKDEGSEASASNASTDEGRTYSLVLTATEMQAARIAIIVEDQTSTKTWLDTTIIIETYGHASAQHAFDLDAASTAQTGDSFARIGATGSGLTTLATAAALTTHDGKLDIADAAVDAVQTSLDNGTYGLSALKTLIDAIQAEIDSGTYGLSALKTLVDALPTGDENALALLKYDFNGITGEAARSTLNALRFLRNKWSTSGGTLTVTKENDTDAAWTAALTSDAAADPITGSDPA